ncbi:hypothetical protein AVEN_225777-1 [Araneus ventricosus]|uniref:Uncharacterized protein n=1 Tax=Araneus ventricosus TaxID=182803 RepID=A0A4Y2BD49_ARAVE|nr:hypothetical protein AVEN_225777-1 [Araneus ventricosus]
MQIHMLRRNLHAATDQECTAIPNEMFVEFCESIPHRYQQGIDQNAEGTLKSDLWAKLGMVDLDSRVVLIKPSLDSAPQTFPEASVMSFTHRSTAFVNWACLECYIPIRD